MWSIDSIWQLTLSEWVVLFIYSLTVMLIIKRSAKARICDLPIPVQRPSFVLTLGRSTLAVNMNTRSPAGTKLHQALTKSWLWSPLGQSKSLPQTMGTQKHPNRAIGRTDCPWATSPAHFSLNSLPVWKRSVPPLLGPFISVRICPLHPPQDQLTTWADPISSP